MPSDHALPTSRPRPFVTVAYVPGSGSALVPAVMPPSCVHVSKGDPACALVVHHTRERKTGPQIPVTVVQIDDSTVNLTDRRWWATQTSERLAQSAALLGVHPGLPVPDAEAIAFRLELPRLVLRQATDAYAHALFQKAPHLQELLHT